MFPLCLFLSSTDSSCLGFFAQYIIPYPCVATLTRALGLARLHSVLVFARLITSLPFRSWLNLWRRAARDPLRRLPLLQIRMTTNPRRRSLAFRTRRCRRTFMRLQTPRFLAWRNLSTRVWRSTATGIRKLALGAPASSPRTLEKEHIHHSPNVDFCYLNNVG